MFSLPEAASAQHRAAQLTLYFVNFMVAIAIPVCIYELVTVKAEQHVIVWFIAGVFALVAIPLSLHDGTSGKAMCGCV